MMSSWADFAIHCPDLAARMRASFDAYLHKVLATIRKDGSPRLTGTEVDFLNGQIWIGSMPGSRRAADLLRDPRCALHNAPADETISLGDAKVSARATHVDSGFERNALMEARLKAGLEVPEGPFHIFRLDITEVALTSIAPSNDHLVIEAWRPGKGITLVKRH